MSQQNALHETTPTAPSKPPGPRRRPRGLDLVDRLKSATPPALRAVEFGDQHVRLSTVDRVARLLRTLHVKPRRAVHQDVAKPGSVAPP
jgi:hypothetical protein